MNFSFSDDQVLLKNSVRAALEEHCKSSHVRAMAEDGKGYSDELWGEMGKLVLAKDWSCTPLGPIESWPQSLRTTVSLCLASNFPISIAWGPSRVQIYNDGYWPICAAKHPHSMGQDWLFRRR